MATNGFLLVATFGFSEVATLGLSDVATKGFFEVEMDGFRLDGTFTDCSFCLSGRRLKSVCGCYSLRVA